MVAAGGAPRRRRRASRSFDAGSSVDWTEGGGDALAFDKEVGASKNARENENDTSVDAATLATLDAMDAHVRAAAAARRGAERDASSARSLVAGGLTPAAVAAKRADAAAAAAAAERERQSSAAYIARGGLFGNPKAFGAFGAGARRKRKPGAKKKSRFRAFGRRLRRRAPPIFCDSARARVPTGSSSTTTRGRTRSGGARLRSCRRTRPAVPLREATSSGASAADLARARTRRGEPPRVAEAPESPGLETETRSRFRARPGEPERRRSRGGGQGAGRAEAPPETVTDAFSARDGQGVGPGVGEERAPPAAARARTAAAATFGPLDRCVHRSHPSVRRRSDRLRERGPASDRTPRALYASGAPLLRRLGARAACWWRTCAEHRRAVRALAASADGLFFVSGGDDGECKLWDRGRLERDARSARA